VPTFRTIVWATDGSENADKALSVAKMLTRENGASLLVVHIVQKYATKAALAVYADEEQVEAKLKRVVEELSGEGLDASLKIVEHIGPPARARNRRSIDPGSARRCHVPALCHSARQRSCAVARANVTRLGHPGRSRDHPRSSPHGRRSG
jgi:hypothetical protein